MILVCGTRGSLAQLPTATILGVVRDASGAVMPEATLTARHQQTGQTRSALTAADGSYRFSALPVGPYEVRVEHAGFRSEVRSGLTLTVGQEAVVNFTLELGAVEQTVAVTAEAPLVNTTTGSLGGLVDEQRVADLPLNGRNYIDLTLLQPGVQQQSNRTYTGSMTGTWLSSNGAPIRSNNYLLDGAIMQNLMGATSASVSGSTLGLEGIREYRVVTNSFSAEYGMTMGSQTMIVSKSGTNAFHGSLFEYLRNDNLDARNFFDRKTAITPGRLPEFKRNNFGASFGGPIQKDKTFFYGVYEGLRERLGITSVSNTIAPSSKVDGGLVPQISPVIRPLLTLYPDPNLPNNQFTFPFSQPTREDYGQMRVDTSYSNSDMIFGRYTASDAELIQALPFPQFQTVKTNRAQYATLSDSHIFSPALLNTIRFSYSRTNIFLSSPNDVSGPQFSFLPGRDLGQISIGGVSAMGPNNITPLQLKQNIFTWSDDLFYTAGRHSLKFGALINRYQQYLNNGTNVRGTVTFADVRNFLLAQPTTLNAVTPGSVVDRTYHYTTLGFYAQDDFPVRSDLRLNLGLRYEFQTEVQEVRGRGSALRDIVRGSSFTIGPPFRNATLRNVSPRFGFAWDVRGNGKTAVRGGFGLLYDLGNVGSTLLIGTGTTPPFSSQSTVSPPIPFTIPFVIPAGLVGRALRPLDYNLQQPHMLQYHLTIEQQLPSEMALTLAYAGSRGLNLMMTREGNPTVPQILADGRPFWRGNEPRINPNWTTVELKTAGGDSWYDSLQFGLTKRLSKGLQFQSSYTWSKTMDQTQSQLVNDNNTSSSWPVHPDFLRLDRAPANFDATHNWRLNAIYRLPDLISSGAVLDKLLNGWGVSSILSLQTGAPFSPSLQTNRSRTQVGGGAANIDRPDLVAGRSNEDITNGASRGCPGVASGRKLGGADLYFDPCAFSLPELGYLGTAGRNILRSPGLANWDFSLVKDTALGVLGESGKLEFRAEFFNLLNRANFDAPNRTVFGQTATPLGNAGLITNTATSSRQIQFALKLLF
ncbi:MAG: TonB-dependent receptor [Acidobacteria bacterium]|nr:TonB-dependent receptor [Acidobacteriota bacterium]